MRQAPSRAGTFVCLVLFALLMTIPVFAADDLHVASAVPDTLIISARALGDAINPSAGGLVSVIDFQGRGEGRELADLLGPEAGFQVRRYGGLGFAAVPSLRGSAAAQIRLFVDGMPVDDAQSGSLDLSLLPVDRFARAEIHRGVVPAGLGGAGGAGAVNLVTRSDDDGWRGLIHTGGSGSLGGRLGWGASSEDESRALHISVHGRRADNDFEYLDNNQTFHNAEDDTLRLRENAWFEQWGVWTRGRLAAGPWKLSSTAGFFRKDGGRPGPINHPSTQAGVRHERADAGLRLGAPGSLYLDASLARTEQFLFDPHNEIEDGFGGDIRSVSGDAGGRLSWEPTLWRHPAPAAALASVSLNAGVGHRLQDFRQWYGDDQDPRRQRLTTSLFAALPLELAGGRVRLVPAWRYQYLRDDFPPLPTLPWLPEEEGGENRRHDVAPSLGLVWELSPEKVFLEAHAARSVRVPTWVEVFGHRGGIAGNRELVPEEIEARDVALTLTPGDGLSLRLAYFRSEVSNTIVFLQNSPGTSKAENIGATRNSGLELELRLETDAGWAFQSNLTHQKPEDVGDIAHLQGNRLPYLSSLEMDTRLARVRGTWRPWLEVALQGPRYRDRENTELIKAPARALLNLGLGWNIRPEVEISASVINLTDDRSYDIVHHPLPGRTWQVTMRVAP